MRLRSNWNREWPPPNREPIGALPIKEWAEDCATDDAIDELLNPGVSEETKP